MSKYQEFQDFKVALKKRAATDLGKAFNCLENNISDYSDYYNTVIWQIGRYNQILKEANNGTVNFSDKNLIINRLREAFTQFVDKLEAYDFDSFDILRTEPIDLSFKRKTKELKKNIEEIEKQKWKKYLWSFIPILLISMIGSWYLGNSTKSKSGSTKVKTEKGKPVSLEQSFNQLFQKGKIFPYSDNSNLPCFSYQGKWELDKKAPYILSIPLDRGRGIYYYKAKSLHFYSWCDKQDSTGNKLKGLEFFTNELWEDSNKRDLEITVDTTNFISEDNGFVKVAEISSLFTDEIDFDKNNGIWKPFKREGEKIIRYTPTEKKEGYDQVIEDVIDNYLGKLYQTNCPDLSCEGINFNSFIPVKKDSAILQFNCEFTSIKGEENLPVKYKKRIIFKGEKRNPEDNK